jgi:putative lipoic acid-binding regulatory protein
MTGEPTASLLMFPCDFPIKVFGLNQDGLEPLVMGLVRIHVSDIAKDSVSTRLSEGGKYAAVTVTVKAQSQAQLDAIYRELTACPAIIMAL